MKYLLAIIISILLLSGCENPTHVEQQFELLPEKTGFPFDKRSNNIAALFTMTNENGRIQNLQMMESVFDDGNLGFKHQRHHNVSSPYIYDKLIELSKEVGEYGTLLVYFNSHGGGSGNRFIMSASGGSFKLSRAVDAISKGGKVKRLIVLIDTCHASGGIQEGFEGNERKINPRTGLPELTGHYNYGSSEAYEECLVIASSSVEDLSIRGAFASRLQRAYRSAEGRKITISEFLKEFSSLHSDTSQKPYYKCLPDDRILEEPLFENALIRSIPIIDRNNNQGKYPPDYIPVPN